MGNIAVNNTPLPGSGTDQTPFYPGTQRPLLKHKDKQGSTEHHKRGGGSVDQGLTEYRLGGPLTDGQLEDVRSLAGVSNDVPDILVEMASAVAGYVEQGSDIQEAYDGVTESENLQGLTEMNRKDRKTIARMAESLSGKQVSDVSPAERHGQAERDESGEEQHKPSSLGPNFDFPDVGGGASPSTARGQRTEQRRSDMDQEELQPLDPSAQGAVDELQERGMMPGGDRKTSRSQTTLSDMFSGLGKGAIGQQTPILEKHKDSQGSTEHHKRGAGSKGPGKPGGSQEFGPYDMRDQQLIDEMIGGGMSPEEADEYVLGPPAPILEKHKDSQGSTEHHKRGGGTGQGPAAAKMSERTQSALDSMKAGIENPQNSRQKEWAPFNQELIDTFEQDAGSQDQSVADGLAEIAGNTTDSHRVEQVNEFTSALKGAEDPSDLRAIAENLAEMTGNTTHEHRDQQIQQFQQHLAEEWNTETPRSQSPEAAEEAAEEERRDQEMLTAERERASQQDEENARAAGAQREDLGERRRMNSQGNPSYQQSAILEKHKDKQGSTEHHKRGGGAEQGPSSEGSKGLFEGRPYGIGDLSGDQLAEITGDDRDKQPLGNAFYRTLPDGTEVAVTRQNDGQYHITPTVPGSNRQPGYEVEEHGGTERDEPVVTAQEMLDDEEEYARDQTVHDEESLN